MCAKDKIFSECDEFDLGEQRPKSRKIVYYNLLQSMKMKHNLVTLTVPKKIEDELLYTYDNLSALTAYTKQGLDVIGKLFQKAQDTVAYRILTKMTQPAHLLLFLAVVTLACFGGLETKGQPSKIWAVLYVTAFATHFGTHIWMNLVAGLVLYFSIPRKVFGDIQVVLFPAYYVFQSVMSFMVVAAYLKLHPITTQTSFELVIALIQTTRFLTELCIRLFIAPNLLKLKYKKSEMENVAGNGQEIGKLVLGELQNCPHYMKILVAFRKVHTIVAILSMLLLAIDAYELIQLVNSLCML